MAQRSRPEVHLRCPICGTNWNASVPPLDGPQQTVGSRCNDWSQGQQRPCVGLLMPTHEVDTAEWRFGYIAPEDDPRFHAIRRELPVNGRPVPHPEGPAPDSPLYRRLLRGNGRRVPR